MHTYTYPEAIIVAAVAVLFGAWLYMRSTERKRRLEILHQERLSAMEKGIPLPELPLAPEDTRRPADTRAPLVHGIVWTALGWGGTVALLIIGPLPSGQIVWPLALPLMFLGVGLILYYALVSRRTR